MGDNVIWLTTRFSQDAASQARRAFALAHELSDLGESEFAEQLSASLPSRTISADHVGAWKAGPTPPPGDVLYHALRLAGLDVLSGLQAIAAGAEPPSDPAMKPAGGGGPHLPSLDSKPPDLSGFPFDFERINAGCSGLCRPDSRMLRDLSALTGQYARLNDTVSPATLAYQVHSHYLRLRGLLSVTSPPALRQPLGSITGETAMLLGWLAFLLEDWHDARRLWGEAQGLAEEFDEDELLAHVLIARSSLVSCLPHGGRGGSPSLSISLLNDAEVRVRASPSRRIWLLSRRAEEHAAAGDRRASAQDLIEAERSLDGLTEVDVLVPGPRNSLDLAGFRGNCALLLGRKRDCLEAVDVLREAITRAPADRATLRSVLLSDLGVALAQLGEADLACDAFEQALDLAEETGATVHAQRVTGAVRCLGQTRDCKALRQLNERLRLLA